MNVKNTLKDRIRGWFPHEPTLISTRLMVNHEYKQPPLIIPSEYNVSSTKITGGFAVFWTIFFGLNFLTSFNFGIHSIPLFQIISWILAGLTVGIISTTILTKNQLSRLSKDYQFTPNKKEFVLLIVPIVLFFIFGGFVNWFLYSSLHLWLLSLLSWGVCTLITRTILFAAFEKKENMRLMQSWTGTDIFLVPKAPNSNPTV